MTSTTSTTSTTAATAATEPEPSFEELAERTDRAIRRVSELDGPAREVAEELKAAIEAVHKAGLVTFVRRMRADDHARDLLFALVDEPEVRMLLALHGIIRADPMTEANRVLQTVRPQLQSHGGDVELVRIEDRVAYVRLSGPRCAGPTGSPCTATCSPSRTRATTACSSGGARDGSGPPVGAPEVVRRRITVAGVVQGVGFRPFVYRLACELGVTGLVGNDSTSVFVEAQGDAPAVDAGGPDPCGRATARPRGRRPCRAGTGGGGGARFPGGREPDRDGRAHARPAGRGVVHGLPA